MRKSFIDALTEFYYELIQILPSILFALVVMLIIGAVGYFASNLLERRLRKRKHEPILRIFLVSVLRWTLYLFALITALDIIGLSGVLGGFVAGAGISAIIIGFAFKDIAENFLAGILLAFSRPFRLGDIIEVEKFRGRVKNIELRTTNIRTNDGRDILLPNAMVIKGPLTNYTRDGLIRYQFTFGIDTPVKTSEVRRIIMNHLLSESDILVEPRPAVALTEINSTDVTIRVSFWVNLFREKTKDRVDLGEPILSKVMDKVKELMIENGINMPGHIIELKSYDESQPIYLKNSNQ